MEQKKHDWFAALFYNDVSLEELAANGVNIGNSSLQDRDYYKNFNDVQQTFKTEDGKFDENKFNQFYDSALRLYNSEGVKNVLENITDTYSYDELNYFVPAHQRTRKSSWSISASPNPDRRSIGLMSVGVHSAPTMTPEEVAQTNRVYSYENQSWMDWSPNEAGLATLWKPTMVLAQYDKDEEEIVNGRVIHHKKGEYKLNEKGEYYYETLGNRSAKGKSILHTEDVLTVDGSEWNKYDFFDADGFTKSTAGIIAKTVVKAIPMLIPGGGWAAAIRGLYGGISAVIAMNQFIPNAIRAIDGMIRGGEKESELSRALSNYAAGFERFGSNTSVEGRQSFFSLENIGQLVVLSASQLVSQRFISQIPQLLSKLTKTPLTENSMKWGAGLAKTYLVGTASSDAYDAYLDAGASPRMAGLGAIATAFGFYKLLSNNYFNFEKYLFNGSYLDKSKIKTVSKDLVGVVKKTFGFDIEDVTNSRFKSAKWIKDASNAIQKRLQNLSPDSLFGQAVSEGIEETMEEVISDSTKGIFATWNWLFGDNKSLDFGFSFEDMASRYATSLVGGAIGGATFGLHNMIADVGKKSNPTVGNDDLSRQILYLAREGKTGQLINELESLRAKGKLGSTSLGIESELIKDGTENKLHYKPISANGTSQNDAIYNQSVAFIKRIEELAELEKVDLSEEELNSLIFRYEQEGLSKDEATQRVAWGSLQMSQELMQQTEKVLHMGIHTTLFEDFNNLGTEIIATRSEMENMLQPRAGQDTTDSSWNEHRDAVLKSERYKALESKLNKLRAKRDDLLSGKYNKYYISQVLFAGSPKIVNGFVNDFGVHAYTKYHYNKDFDALSQEEQTAMLEEYQKYSSFDEKQKIVAAHKVFSQLNVDMANTIENLGEKTKRSDVYRSSQVIEKTLQNNLNHLTKQLVELNKNKTENAEEIYQVEQAIQQTKQMLEQARKTTWDRLSPNFNFTYAEDIHQNAEDYKEWLSNISQNGFSLDRLDTPLINLMYNITNNISESNGLNTTDNSILDEKLGRIGSNLTTDDVRRDVINAVDLLRQGKLNEFINAYERIFGDEFDDNVREALLAEIFPTIKLKDGEVSLITYIEQIAALKNGIKTSTAEELLTNLASKLGIQTDLIELLHKEEDTFISKEVEEYLIRNPYILQQLKTLKQLINIAKSLVHSSSKKGLNSRLQLLGDKVAIISDDAIYQLTEDLARLDSKIDVLLEVADANNQQKLRIQKDIHINIRGKLIHLLLDDSDSKQNFTKRFLQELNIDINSLFKDITVPADITEDNLKEWEQIGCEIETRIYQAVADKNLDSAEISKKLLSVFDSTVVHMNSTELTSDEDVRITDYDQLVYLATIISAPSHNFYQRWKEIVQDAEFAPIFSQEYAVRIGYSFLNNPTLFKEITARLKEIESSNDDDVYVQNKALFDAFLVIFGGAGTGKTTVIAKALKEFFPNADFAVCGVTDNQVENISKNSGINTKYTKEELLKHIIGKATPDVSAVESTLGVETLTWKNEGLNAWVPFKKSASHSILFIDEISLWTRPELEVLNAWAANNGISIVFLGDNYQTSATTLYNKMDYPTGIEDGYFIKTPYLLAPMRPENIAKQDNYTILHAILSKIHKEAGPKSSHNKLSTIANKVLENTITLKYFNDTNGKFSGGTKIISIQDNKAYLDELISNHPDSKIAIITDSDTYNVYKSNTNITVDNPLNVHGLEFDYIFVDLSMNNKYEALKNVYTITQRSKKGSIFVNQGINIASVLDNDSQYTTHIDETQIVDYKNWRLDNMPNVIGTINTKNPIQPGVNGEGGEPKVTVGTTFEMDASRTISGKPVYVNEVTTTSDAVQCKAEEFFEKFVDKFSNDPEGIKKKYIRDYIIYGHTNISDINQKIRLELYLQNALKDKTYKYVVEGRTLYALFENEQKKFWVPLVIVPEGTSVGNYDSATFSLGSLIFTKSNVINSNDLHTNLSSEEQSQIESKFYTISSPRILVGNQNNLSQEVQDFMYNGSVHGQTAQIGRTFVALTGDSLATKSDFDDFFTTSKDGKWAVNKDNVMRLAGANYTLTVEEVIEKSREAKTLTASLINMHGAMNILLHIIKTLDASDRKRAIENFEKWAKLKSINLTAEGGGTSLNIKSDWGAKTDISWDEFFEHSDRLTKVEVNDKRDKKIFSDQNGSKMLKEVLEGLNLTDQLYNTVEERLQKVNNWHVIFGQDWKEQETGLWSETQNKAANYILPKVDMVYGHDVFVNLKRSNVINTPSPLMGDGSGNTNAGKNTSQTLQPKPIDSVLLTDESEIRQEWKSKGAQEISFKFEGSWIYNIISVSLQDGTTQNFIVYKENGQFMYKEIHDNLLAATEVLVPIANKLDNDNLKGYIYQLLTSGKSDRDATARYLKEIRNNQDNQDINNAVNNYLISKLNGCL